MMNSNDKRDEGFPASSVVLTADLATPQNSNSVSGEIEFTEEDYRTALRLLVGAMLEGNDELRERARTWLTNIQKAEQEINASILKADTGGSKLVYSTIGLLFKTPRLLSRVTQTAGRASSRATHVAARFTRPIKNSWVLRPVRRGYHGLTRRVESRISSLENIGRYEASSSRALIRQEVNDEAVEEFLTYMVEKSKMREMIVETSAEVGGDALDEMRGRTASVDSSLDNFVDNILRRQKAKTPPSDSTA
jgi:hypothetical protein